jgi:hypothetical protein
VLVSAVVKDLVVGSALDFCERGDYELRGVHARRLLEEAIDVYRRIGMPRHEEMARAALSG